MTRIDLPSKPGNHRVPCPECQKGRRDDALSVTVERDGSAVWYCFRCGLKGGQKADFYTAYQAPLQKDQSDTSASAADTEEPPIGLKHWEQPIWRECRPWPGTLVEIYLRNRGIDPEQDCPVRFHPSLWHKEAGTRMPGMVTPVVPIDADDDAEPVMLHRTFLKPDGSGTTDIKPKRKYGGGVEGNVAKLTPDSGVTDGLALAEGVETALSATMTGLPCWACLDAGNLAAFPVLPGIECLTIVTDHDKAGIDAAETVARRWAEAGRETRILLPRDIGADLNDCASEVLHG